MNSKQVLRKEMKQILNKLNNEEKTRQSTIIQQKIINHEKYKNSKRISIYLSLKSEVDTSLILNQLFKDKKQCFIPRYKNNSINMEMIELESLDEYNSLPKTNWGIKQHPDDCTKEDASNLDLILIPGFAFSLDGARLGKGGGYYDYYCSKLKEKNQLPYIIGLAFKEQIRNDIPMTNKDFKINEVITI